MTEVRIDAEFQNWIIPLTAEEYSGLEKSILEDGCRDPLVIWEYHTPIEELYESGLGVCKNETCDHAYKQIHYSKWILDDGRYVCPHCQDYGVAPDESNLIIVDGHHRFKICKDHHIPFKTVEKGFVDRDDAKIWMFHNQIARRNLVPFQRAELALKAEPLIAAKAKEKQKESGGAVPQKSAKPPIDTREELAKSAKVSHDTISKVRKIVEKAPEEVKAKLRTGETTINAEFNKIKNDEDLQERREELKKKVEMAAALPGTIKPMVGDFLTDYIKIPADSIDCIITDPPYVKEWLHNYDAFAKAAAYVLKPGGFLVFYVGHIHMDKVLAQMTPYLEYYWIAMLKHAGTNAAVHSRSVQCGMKPILIFNKSPRMKPKRYFNDVIIGTGKEKDAHEWQQGEEELRMIFEPFTDPGDTILDPFMGSGTVISMAKKMNRLAIGFDIDAENVELVKGRLIP